MKTALRLRKSGEKLLDLGTQTVKIFSFADAKGNDWTDIQKEFSEDTMKLIVDNTGMIRGYTEDVTAIALSASEVTTVTEVNHEDLPEGFEEPANFTSWAWFAGKGISKRILPDDEVLAVNSEVKSDLLATAIQEIAPLTAAVKYDMASDEEKARLELLEKFLVTVNRIDASQRDIVWPSMP